MKHYITIVAILLCYLHNIAIAQNKTTLKDHSLLWQVSHKDMKKPSYLFGTIHLICPQDYVWTSAMKKSFLQSDEICFELDLDDPNMVMQVATAMLNTSGKTLKDYFSESDYKKLSEYIRDSLKMDIAIFAQMKPVALQTLFVTKNSTCDSTISYEYTLMEEANKLNKEIIGLETVSEQIDLFDNLPIDSVVKDIMATVDGNDTCTNEFDTLVAAYKKQDLPQLYKLIKESNDVDIDAFLDVRNEKWIPRIIEKMDTHSVFFAVGAGHLYGDNGVINLLRKAGYTVTPVK